ncbi:unnamed protein product [Paramecium sonneborni]|uniref:Methyltransferase type 12 domain-containing protein n=1 Tax=Paramecium sonneborni TaxID=65129 RepID=A0A8S1MH48_9CILI|nr:unnamed protein product [Paramecium sonneborni]
MIYSIVRKTIQAINSTFKEAIDYTSTALYDLLISHPIDSLTYEKLCERLTGQQKRILVVNVGTGVPLNKVLDRFPLNCDITAIDINQNYLRKANQLFKDKPQVKLYQLNFNQINQATFGTFDVIVFSSSFFLLQQPTEILQQAISLLNPGGRIYFMVILSEYQFFDTFKYITSIDLHLSAERDFQQFIEQSQLKISHKQRLQKVTNITTLLLKLFIYETHV